MVEVVFVRVALVPEKFVTKKLVLVPFVRTRPVPVASVKVNA